MTFKQTSILLIGILCAFFSCKEDTPEKEEVSTPLTDCYEPNDSLIVTDRSFQMGFSTWAFAPTQSAKEQTYNFLSQNGDIYSEQFDDHIPWFGLMDGKPLPEPAVMDLNHRVNHRIDGTDLVASISLFNPERDGLITGYNGESPAYEILSEKGIEDTYFTYISTVLADFSNLKYLVMAMEINEFYAKKPAEWNAYKELMTNLRPRLREAFPNVKLSESITLHNLVDSDNQSYVDEVVSYVNTLDFVAVSYYPFIHGRFSDQEIQASFDFLHENITAPIAFVETAQIAEDLEIPDLSLPADECTQKDYVQLLLSNADANDYEFVIWWTHKDYDELWETFPDEVKPLGKLWRDTGLINEKDQTRPGLREWEAVFGQ